MVGSKMLLAANKFQKTNQTKGQFNILNIY